MALACLIIFDVFLMGNSQQIPVRGIRFGMASKAGSDFNDLPADGVLGLSLFASGEDSSNEKPFLQQLVESGALFGPGYMVYLAADPKAEVRYVYIRQDSTELPPEGETESSPKNLPIIMRRF